MKIDLMLTNCTFVEIATVEMVLRPFILRADASCYARTQKNGKQALIITDCPDAYGLDPPKDLISPSDEKLESLKVHNL